MNDSSADYMREAIHHWNSGDVGMLLSWFAEDIAYSSPLVKQLGETGSSWLQGRQEVAQHLMSIRKTLDQLELIEILTGAGFVNLLLQHSDGLLSMNIEYEENRLARRIIVCHSSKTLAKVSG